MQKTVGHAPSPLVPFSFEQRDPVPTNVRIEILFCCGGSTFSIVPDHEIIGRVTAIGSAIPAFKFIDQGGSSDK